MQAILFPERNSVDLATLPDPRPGPGEVLVAVRASGICHTDIEVLRGNYGTSAFPVVPGHEYAGVIEEIGAGVQGLAPGDRVAVDPNVECGRCAACTRGWAHLCEDLRAYGVTQNGGFADRSVVRAGAVHPIGDMAYDKAALAEPLGCVLNGLGAARAEQARNALIIGAGPIGLLLAFGLRGVGVTDITLSDLEPSRLDLARELGFGTVSARDPNPDLRHAFDLAIDATGVPAVAAGLIDHVANGGTGLFFGVCPSQARIEISPFELFRRQVTLAGSHSLNHNIPQALDLLRGADDSILRLVTHRLPLDEVAGVFRGSAPAGGLKIQAVWPGA
ncbi:alcohol dehydrogenase catalytic domain-containing protein [Marinibacterium profundimaris]|uniref:Zinc-binding dehydrogenase n=1 Tax=Marinibacterium profundimaris TaxID=1679460 RepID=A0A225NP07_9RHOB|nr:alcohol dehydrogenase catalytic domain-containing protein [Marinibacterium profundimaris]OWU72879.1 zinc-binding dehydrogenase [Marinibacterium profundimaris]